MPQQGYLVIAFGPDRYIDMAIALGRSLMLHDPDRPRALVTDSHRPELERVFTHLIPFDPSLGSDVVQKMQLDTYSPFEQTMFIDSDSLVVRPVDHIWEGFAGKTFGAVGHVYLSRGDSDYFLNVDKTLSAFDVERLPKFNGGVYYFERSDRTTAFFEYARSLIARYDEVSDKAFRGVPGDESLYSIAMAVHGIDLVDFGERGMFTLLGSSGRVTLDIFGRKSHFVKEGRVVRPDIIHFAGRWSRTFTYARESKRLLLGADLTPQRTFGQNVRIFLSAAVAGARGTAHEVRNRLKARAK